MPRTNVDRVATKYRRFNDWIRGELREQHKTQRELAEYLNIEQSTLSMRMSGDIEWMFRDVLKVLEYFNASFDVLL